MNIDLGQSWQAVLDEEISKPYFSELCRFVDAAYREHTCYPPQEKIFAAFRRTPFEAVKAVILGQDPYHEEGQAQGLAFYVPDTIKPPPTLMNIAKELGRFPDLLRWADEGVLMLNSTLTVQAHQAMSHRGRGWERFTDAAIRVLAERREHIVFILWGASAQRKGAFIDRSRHLTLSAPHPSPLSAYRGFFGSNPFAKANAYLLEHGIEPVQW